MITMSNGCVVIDDHPPYCILYSPTRLDHGALRGLLVNKASGSGTLKPPRYGRTEKERRARDLRGELDVEKVQGSLLGMVEGSAYKDTRRV